MSKRKGFSGQTSSEMYFKRVPSWSRDRCPLDGTPPRPHMSSVSKCHLQRAVLKKGPPDPETLLQPTQPHLHGAAPTLRNLRKKSRR